MRCASWQGLRSQAPLLKNRPDSDTENGSCMYSGSSVSESKKLRASSGQVHPSISSLLSSDNFWKPEYRALHDLVNFGSKSGVAPQRSVGTVSGDWIQNKIFGMSRSAFGSWYHLTRIWKQGTWSHFCHPNPRRAASHPFCKQQSQFHSTWEKVVGVENRASWDHVFVFSRVICTQPQILAWFRLCKSPFYFLSSRLDFVGKLTIEKSTMYLSPANKPSIFPFLSHLDFVRSSSVPRFDTTTWGYTVKYSRPKYLFWWALSGAVLTMPKACCLSASACWGCVLTARRRRKAASWAGIPCT